MNTVKSFLNRIKSFVLAHKIWSVIIIAVVVFIGYKIWDGAETTEARYVTTTVQKGTIVSSVTGTGQVEASSTIDLKAKSSGTIASVNVKSGATVRKGQTLFVLDAGDAQKSVRDATLNLEIAKSDLANAKKDYENTKASQETSLKNLLFALNSSLVATPDNSNTNTTIINISGSYNSPIQGRYTLQVYACQNGVCINSSGLEPADSFPIDVNVPKKLGNRGLYVTFTSLPKAGEKWYIDVPSPSAISYTSNKRAYEEAQVSIPQAIDAAKTTVTSREITVTQRQNALLDAEESLSDYYIRAPFDGVIASVSANVGDTASESLGTIITKQKIASITLNEVDVSKIDLGQKVTLSFDAVEDLTITGEVVEIDGVGTVTQGVVSYIVKISFDTDDTRIKPGMSVSAAIITAMKQDILVVPASAVKTDANGSYALAFNPALPLETGSASAQGSTSPTPPEQVAVETGISDDTSIEITSGLKEGDQVVSRTVTSSATKTTAAAPSLFGNTGARGTGNVMRAAPR